LIQRFASQLKNCDMHQLNRREFLKAAALSGAGFLVAGNSVSALAQMTPMPGIIHGINLGS
jgi:hypothetical protein